MWELLPADVKNEEKKKVDPSNSPKGERANSDYFPKYHTEVTFLKIFISPNFQAVTIITFPIREMKSLLPKK